MHFAVALSTSRSLRFWRCPALAPMCFLVCTVGGLTTRLLAVEPALAHLKLQQINQKNISRCGTCCGTVEASAKQPRLHLAAPWCCREKTKKLGTHFCRIAGQPPSYFLRCAAWPFGRPGLFFSGSRSRSNSRCRAATK